MCSCCAYVAGRPAGLIKTVGSGVTGLFYEPYLGLMKSPEGAVVGLRKGAGGLVSGVVSGALGTTAAIVGSASKGISQGASLISGDSDFQRDREATKKKTATSGGVMSGLKDGGKSVLSGFTSGVSGLVTKPYDGAKKEGALGFLKGVGKGVVGMAVKPVLGVTDMVTQVAQGISNQVSDNVSRPPYRPQRALGRRHNDLDMRVIVNMEDRAAYAQQFILHRAASGKFTDAFVNYVAVGGKRAAYISDVMIYLVDESSSSGKERAHLHHVIWSAHWTDE